MLPIFVLFSFKIINFVKLQFATSSILFMYVQFFHLISIIYNFHMYRYFAKQKSCILKLLYINAVYNLLSNYIFRLLIRWWWWLITLVYPSSPKSFMRSLILIFAGRGSISWKIFRHCKVGRQYALYLWTKSHFPSNGTNFEINISDCIRNYTCSN